LLTVRKPLAYELQKGLHGTKLIKANNIRKNKMNFQDVLNKVCNGVSDTKTSQKLGVSRVMFSQYRNGHRLPSNEMLDKMVELSGLNPVEVYLATYAEKIDNPQIAEQFRHLAA
jgi:transcriptional regulator with XRE-family HTH domain